MDKVAKYEQVLFFFQEIRRILGKFHGEISGRFDFTADNAPDTIILLLMKTNQPVPLTLKCSGLGEKKQIQFLFKFNCNHRDVQSYASQLEKIHILFTVKWMH